MQIGRVEGATRVMGRNQDEYFGLPIRDELMEVAGHGSQPCMRSAWFPSPAELMRLVAGAPLYLVILGTGHPPVKLEVGDVPSD